MATKRKECSMCNKMMRSDKLSRHEKMCKMKPKRTSEEMMNQISKKKSMILSRKLLMVHITLLRSENYVKSGLKSRASAEEKRNQVKSYCKVIGSIETRSKKIKNL